MYKKNNTKKNSAVFKNVLSGCLGRFLKILMSLLIGITFFGFIKKCMVEPNDLRITISEIKEEYKGVVIDKYSTRNTPPTHLRILVDNKEKIQISPNESIVDYAKVGDSIIKIKDENIVYLKRDQEAPIKFFYTKISYKNRKSKRFPKEWKDKWLESSEWDIENK